MQKPYSRVGVLIVFAALTSAVVAGASGARDDAAPPEKLADTGKRADLVAFADGKPVLITLQRNSGTFPATEADLGLITCKFTDNQTTPKSVYWYPHSGVYKRSTSNPAVATFCFDARVGQTVGNGTLVITIDDTTPVVVTLPAEPGGPMYPCPTTPGGTLSVMFETKSE